MKGRETVESIYQHLASRCAAAEHCTFDIRRKLAQTSLSRQQQEEVVKKLVQNGFVDEKRYAKAFIHDTSCFRHWGEIKIKNALRGKGIPAPIYEPLLKDIEDEDFIQRLIPILKTKERSIKAKTSYELTGKLVRFALGKGYTFAQVSRALKHLDMDADRMENPEL